MSAVSAGVLCAAAPLPRAPSPASTPQVLRVDADVVPLTEPAPAAPKPVNFQNTIYQAAPVPNQDVNAPNSAEAPSTTLSPKLLSPKTLFQGDGYSYGSSQQTTLEERKSPAAGLGLTVPVLQ